MNTLFTITQEPSPILRRRSPFVSESWQTLEKLWAAYDGLGPNKVGLAAPQIGINENVAIVLGMGMANLIFFPVPFLKETDTEGCFSIKFAKASFRKKRHTYGLAFWMDVNGRPHLKFLKHFDARVFQHELDHINGKLCSDV